MIADCYFTTGGQFIIFLMTSKILQTILAKQGDADAFEFLSQHVSGTELNSFLLEVFNARIAKFRQVEIQRQYENNRFVQPLELDPIAFAEYELALLRQLRQLGFEVFESSPLCPLGTCSVLGPVDQRNVVSALRQTEVVADVTNVMALEVARRRRRGMETGDLQLCATHRHVRAQQFDFPGFTPHFKVLALVSAGRDRGNFTFEVEQIIAHVRAYVSLLHEILGLSKESLSFKGEVLYGEDASYLQAAFERVEAELEIRSRPLQSRPQSENRYYRGFRFKIVWQHEGEPLEIIDGGIVDWTQQLTGNRKERLLISGMGTEFVFRRQATPSRKPAGSDP